MTGRCTNKCKKNMVSIIIASLLAGLTNATRNSSSCNNFALSVFLSYSHLDLREKEVPELVDILKPPPCGLFV